MTNDEILRRDKAFIIATAIRNWWNRKKQKSKRLMATIKIQTFYRMRLAKNYSFIKVLELHKYPRVYILKEQKP